MKVSSTCGRVLLQANTARRPLADDDPEVHTTGQSMRPFSVLAITSSFVLRARTPIVQIILYQDHACMYAQDVSRPIKLKSQSQLRLKGKTCKQSITKAPDFLAWLWQPRTSRLA